MKSRESNSGARLIPARGAAFKLCKSLGHPHPREVPLEDLAMHLNVLVHEGPMKGAEGRLIRKNGRGIIHVRNDIRYEGRRRFTIAHELGHWELHKEVSQFLCEEEDMRDYGRSPMEMEANCFAAELLMPTIHFRDACGKALPSMQLCKNLAKEFETTLTATAIRYADMSRSRVVIVWVYEGVIRWCYSKPEHHLPFVVAGREPPAYSSATLGESEISSELNHYEGANWFPELSYTLEVLEVTKRMPRLNGGLTLLYFP